MTTPTNWPNPERIGEPMFPEYCGKHELREKVTGKSVFGKWDADCTRTPAWDIVALYEQTPKTVARYFDYVGCKEVTLTPAQISEMLAGERERCAQAAQKVSDEYYEKRDAADNDDDRVYADERMCAASECAAAIRNLGAAS